MLERDGFHFPEHIFKSQGFLRKLEPLMGEEVQMNSFTFLKSKLDAMSRAIKKTDKHADEECMCCRAEPKSVELVYKTIFETFVCVLVLFRIKLPMLEL